LEVPSVTTLFTIGYQRRPLSELIGLLQEAGVDGIIDIRLRNTSHLAGYTKRDDLAFLLREGFGIAYEHRPDLAPTAEIFDAYMEDHDWSTYEDRFPALLKQRQVESVGQEILTHYRAPCLLCREATPEHCHRRLVAEYWSEHIPDLTIVHL
jgi:uncharacterized protein (DUF488 family)